MYGPPAPVFMLLSLKGVEVGVVVVVDERAGEPEEEATVYDRADEGVIYGLLNASDERCG